MRRTTAWLIAGLMMLVWACGGEGEGTGTSDVVTAETESDRTELRERPSRPRRPSRLKRPRRKPRTTAPSSLRRRRPP